MGGLKQSQWTPTKRRGPIAAEFSGPGPAAVALPTFFGKCLISKESIQALIKYYLSFLLKYYIIIQYITKFLCKSEKNEDRHVIRILFTGIFL